MAYEEVKGADGITRSVFSPTSKHGKRTEAMRQQQIKELLEIEAHSIEEIGKILGLHYQTARRSVLALFNSGEILIVQVKNKTNYYSLNTNKRIAIPRIKNPGDNRVAPLTALGAQCGMEDQSQTIITIKQLPGLVMQLALLAAATEQVGDELVTKEVVEIRKTLSQMRRTLQGTLDIIDQFATNYRSWDLELLKAWPYDDAYNFEGIHEAWLQSYRRKYLVSRDRTSLLEQLEDTINEGE
jgi:Mg2+ and Co2+ transporter CorA